MTDLGRRLKLERASSILFWQNWTVHFGPNSDFQPVESLFWVRSWVPGVTLSYSSDTNLCCVIHCAVRHTRIHRNANLVLMEEFSGSFYSFTDTPSYRNSSSSSFLMVCDASRICRTRCTGILVTFQKYTDRGESVRIKIRITFGRRRLNALLCTVLITQS